MINIEFTEPDNATRHLVTAERIDLRYTIEILETPLFRRDEVRTRTFRAPTRKILLTGYFSGTAWEAERRKMEEWMRTWWDSAVYPRAWASKPVLRWATTNYRGTITKLDVVAIAGEENQFMWVMEFVIEI